VFAAGEGRRGLGRKPLRRAYSAAKSATPAHTRTTDGGFRSAASPCRCRIRRPLIKPCSPPWYDGTSLPHGGQRPLSVARERRGRAWEVRRRRPRHWAQKSAEVRGHVWQHMPARRRRSGPGVKDRLKPELAHNDCGARGILALPGAAMRHVFAGQRLAPRPSTRRRARAVRRQGLLFENPFRSRPTTAVRSSWAMAARQARPSRSACARAADRAAWAAHTAP
jgi:hypothetical protein